VFYSRFPLAVDVVMDRARMMRKAAGIQSPSFDRLKYPESL